MVNTPMVPNKFLHLKLLSIALGGPMYDYLSLVSFLEAAPSLETFILTVRHSSYCIYIINYCGIINCLCLFIFRYNRAVWGMPQFLLIPLIPGGCQNNAMTI